MKFFAGFLLVSLLGIHSTSFAAGMPQDPFYCKYFKCKVSKAFICNTIQVRSHPLQYCFMSPSRFENSQPLWTHVKFDKKRPILPLLYFHGAGASNITAQETTFYRATWDVLERDGRAPLPILLTFGPTWFLSRDPNYYSVDDLMNIALPVILTHIRLADSGIVLDHQVALLGGSMGGHNTLQVYMNYPERVKAATAFCSAVAELPPGATPEDIQAYIQRTGATPDIARQMPGIVRPSYVNNEAFWRDNLLTLITTKTSLPPLWANYDDQDDFGFNATNPDLLNQMNGKSNPLIVTHAPGRHCQGTLDHLMDGYDFINR